MNANTDVVEVGGSKIEVIFEDGGDRGTWQVSKTILLDWISQCARAVAAYYGSFPVAAAQLEVSCAKGRHGVMHGRTFGYHGARTTLAIGEQTTKAELNEDWMLVHEMVHWCFPSVEDEHHWIEEGSATYIEPIARVMIHNLTAKRIWNDMVRDMPKGVPDPDDRGLDRTQTWASTYWGGGLFCLLADVRIRQQTKCAKGLRDAMQSIVKNGGVITVDWPLKKAFEIGDRATGTSVLTDLHEQMGHRHMDVDLPALWTQLGVVREAQGITFSDNAPLAAVRRAIVPEIQK
jgi:hypothetical protein